MTFISYNTEKVPKGLLGKVTKIHEDGDAYTEFEGIEVAEWVLKDNFANLAVLSQGVPMRVGFGICKDCGDAGRLKYGARRSRVMRSGSNMGPGGQGEGGAQWAWT